MEGVGSEHFKTENKKDGAQMALESSVQNGRTGEVFFDILKADTTTKCLFAS